MFSRADTYGFVNPRASLESRKTKYKVRKPSTDKWTTEKNLKVVENRNRSSLREDKFSAETEHFKDGLFKDEVQRYIGKPKPRVFERSPCGRGWRFKGFDPTYSEDEDSSVRSLQPTIRDLWFNQHNRMSMSYHLRNIVLNPIKVEKKLMSFGFYEFEDLFQLTKEQFYHLTRDLCEMKMISVFYLERYIEDCRN